MISGAHVILYSRDAEADRVFLSDVLGLHSVDAGGGWLIFALPPSEVAVHPSGRNNVHELYFLCEDVRAFAAEMARRGVAVGPIESRGWGELVPMTLPGGGKVGVYEPRHPRPEPPRRPARRKARKPAAATSPRRPKQPAAGRRKTR
jgi:hypothetical protein